MGKDAGLLRQQALPKPEGHGAGLQGTALAPSSGVSSVGGSHGPALPWVLADGGIQAGALALQLVQTVCPQDLKMQRLIKLAQHRGAEVDLQFHLAAGRHYPPAAAQPGN